jgi:citrate lyase subunit beta/citryl-CoA lyase
MREGPRTPALRRSQLFVPAHVSRYAAKAAMLGADAVILDLEDAVPARERPAARAALSEQAKVVADVSHVIVRVNTGDELSLDLTACQSADIGEVLLPKVSAAADVERARRMCAGLGYHPVLSVLIESPAGLADVHRILEAGPIASVALGIEDIRADLETYAPVQGTSPTLLAAHAQLVLAALAAGVTPLGLLGSIAQYRDPVRVERDAAASWRLGYRGSYCIHPAQVPVLNAAFRPSADDLDWAGRVVEADERARAQGRGAFLVDGDMVDAPLVTRARRIVNYGSLVDTAGRRTSEAGLKQGSFVPAPVNIAVEEERSL